MKKTLPPTLLLILLTTAARAEDITQPTDTRTFTLTAAAPPHPALKYQFLFDNIQDTRPGNAALLYHDAILMMGSDMRKTVDQAVDAFNKDDLPTFDRLVDTYNLAGTDNTRRGVLIDLDLAARSTSCDWLPPPQYIDGNTLLPYLEPVSHGLTPILQLRALRQLQLGKIPDAIDTLRLGYVLSDQIATGPILISSLVSISITHRINNITCRLMNDPHCPNLYWALAEIPERRPLLDRSFHGEYFAGILSSIPAGRRALAGEELSATQWNDLLKQVVSWETNEGASLTPHAPTTTAPADLLTAAQSTYSQTHNVPLDQVTTLDPVIPLGSLYIEQYTTALDDFYKLRTLPYPQLLPRIRVYGDEVNQLRHDTPSNPFLLLLPSLYKAVLLCAKADRELAAMTTVEALRTYAAAHDNHLPPTLDAITEVPLPANPLTGRPFSYKLENDTATLSDPTPDAPLTYTIQLRK